MLDEITLCTSEKDIPFADEKILKKMLIRRTEGFMVRLRWKVLFFLEQVKFQAKSNKYGFKSCKFPEKVPR